MCTNETDDESIDISYCLHNWNGVVWKGWLSDSIVIHVWDRMNESDLTHVR